MAEPANGPCHSLDDKHHNARNDSDKRCLPKQSINQNLLRQRLPKL